MVEFIDEDDLKEEGGKHLAEFASTDDPNGLVCKCVICHDPFEPGRKNEDGKGVRDSERVIVLTCGQALSPHVHDRAGKDKQKRRAGNPVSNVSTTSRRLGTGDLESIDP